MALLAARRDLDYLHSAFSPITLPEAKTTMRKFHIATDDACFSTEQCSRLEKPRGR